MSNGPTVDQMSLKIVLPTRVLLDVKIRKIVAEAVDGAFGVLPRHIDFVAALRPGLRDPRRGVPARAVHLERGDGQPLHGHPLSAHRRAAAHTPDALLRRAALGAAPRAAAARRTARGAQPRDSALGHHNPTVFSFACR